MDRDGRFDLYYHHGWAHLAVYPPQEDGRPVYHEDVINRMRILGCPHVSARLVRDVVERADGKPFRLVEWPGGERLASAIRVDLREDGMWATVTVSRPLKGAAAPTADDVLDALRGAGVTHGINREAILGLLADARYDERIEAAAGDPPVHARSAKVVYHFDPHRGRPYLVMEFDRINLRELNFVENISEGDLLAELEPPVAASDGRSVLGDVVPARRETEEVRLVAGSNTELRADGTALIATADGNVRLVQGTVLVEPVVTVACVDYSTGNIRFDGSVVVEKDVADGFVVEAKGDIQIGRGVGRATLKAGGNVLLKAGVNGGGTGRIECEGDLFAKYLESSTVVSHGNVFAEEAIMHSHVTTWKHCVLNGRRSEIIASTIVVAGSLWCKKLGSIAEAPTRVSIGVNPGLLEAFRTTRQEIESCESRMGDLERQVDQIDRAVTDGRTEQKLLQQKLLQQKLLDLRERLAAELTEARMRMPELRHRLHGYRENLDASRESRLVVEDTIFHGAVIVFGAREYYPPEKGARKTVLRSGVDGIREEGYNPAAKPRFSFEGH